MDHWDSIVTLPQLNLACVQAHLDVMMKNPACNPYFQERFMVQASGGSSGHPMVMAYDWDEWIMIYLSFIRPMMVGLPCQHSSEQDVAPGAPVQTAVLGTSSLTHMSCLLGKTFATPQIVTHRFDRSFPMATIVKQLNDIQPVGLSGYASFLYDLAREAIAGRLSITPKRVVTSSEPLYPYIAEVLAKAWGIVPGNSYVTTESGCVGWSCPLTGSMHLNEDLHLVETNAEGGILITNIFHRTVPLIRYAMSDNLEMTNTPCKCGTSHGTIVSITGRVEDEFRYPGDITVTPKMFLRELERMGNVDFQLLQTEDGAHLKLVGSYSKGVVKIAQQMETSLGRLGLASPRVTIEWVDHLPTTPVDKVRKFISRS